MWWSPDSTRLVYGVFDDTEVDILILPRYGSWSTAKNNRQGYGFLQNFLHDQFRYPKAGTTNPAVSLVSAEVGSPTRPVRQSVLAPPSVLQGQAAHFTSVTWADHHTVAVNWMSRVQNVSAINLCPLDTSPPQCRQVHVQVERDGWVDYKFKPVFNAGVGPSKFVAILPAASLRYRPRQLFLVDSKAGSRSMLTSQEDQEVTEVVSWPGQGATVYFMATVPGDPGARHLHSLLLGSGQQQCLTCSTKEMVPTLRARPPCQFIAAKMSKQGSYYLADCHGPGVPHSTLHDTKSGHLLTLWEDNSRLQRTYRGVDSPTVEYRQVTVPGTQQKAQVMLYLPLGYQTYLPGDAVPPSRVPDCQEPPHAGGGVWGTGLPEGSPFLLLDIDNMTGRIYCI